MKIKAHLDPWVQLFAFTALVSGLMTGTGFLGRMPQAAMPAPPAAVAAPAPSAATGADWKAALTSVALPSAPSLTGAGVQKTIANKTPGRWIVDAAGAADSDTPSLGDAVHSAKDKDVIILRPGVYQGAIATAKKDLTIEGSSSDREQAIIQSTAFQTFAAASGSIQLKNLTIDHSPSLIDHGAALSVTQAKVDLVNVKIVAKPKTNGVLVREGVFSAADTLFDGGYSALSAHDGSDLKLERCTFVGPRYAVELEDRGTRATLSWLKVTGAQYGLQVREQAEAIVKDSVFEGGDTAVTVRKKARLTMSDSSITGNEQGVILGGAGTSGTFTRLKAQKNRYGLQLWEEAQATIEASEFSENRDAGIYVMDANAKAAVAGTTFSGNKQGLSVSGGGRIEAVDCTITDSSQYGALVSDAATLFLTRCTVLRSRDMGVFSYKRAKLTLKSTQIRESGDAGMAVGEDSSATLEDVTIAKGGKVGIAVARDGRLEASASSVLDNRRCAIAFVNETGTALLRKTKLKGNECGIAFFDGGVVDSEGGDFLGNEKGAFMFQEKNKSKIALRGSNNKTK